MSETLLTRVPPEELSEGARAAWEALNELTNVPTFVEVFAKAPELLDFAMVQFYQNIFFQGRVAERYKQLSRLRLSMNHGCRTCNLQNLVGVADIGYSQDQIDAMWRQDYAGFSEDEQAVMELADEIALNNPHGKLTPELHARLKRHFSDEEILELGLCLAVIVGMVKLSFAFGLVEKEDYCEFGVQ
ncbi:MAG: carboxymuconolactone decarboxylase family protein [Xanthomonadales bacterium]|nr:carboxymuconolactone decarboxylase family protein [Xanthomonadales bacterium]NIN59224.1 carboxymuconolactone decarboxylase family protein [Xanthomonadales bacterium]NIN74575.1 carboxymuconolactone decarboxylase family protein [Xanthomonadales bacterium]NIO13992.1 carboxymuconolactone decarboxylase family protein [Xanthomonadales bacterium]NIP11617.1 carboxymuconolactone decarboxylase family protein [Xanthomonadales bacterium]